MAPLRFVTAREMKVEELPWSTLEWLCRPDIVAAEKLALIRVLIPPGKAHAFHHHPEMEEIIYILDGQAEQWVDREVRVLGPGDAVHIPTNVVHGTYNAGAETLRVLAILSPATSKGPLLVDVSQEEPWRSLREAATR